jgi:hypothetical protein
MRDRQWAFFWYAILFSRCGFVAHNTRYIVAITLISNFVKRCGVCSLRCKIDSSWLLGFFISCFNSSHKNARNDYAPSIISDKLGRKAQHDYRVVWVRWVSMASRFFPFFCLLMTFWMISLWNTTKTHVN